MRIYDASLKSGKRPGKQKKRSSDSIKRAADFCQPPFFAIYATV